MFYEYPPGIAIVHDGHRHPIQRRLAQQQAATRTGDQGRRFAYAIHADVLPHPLRGLADPGALGDLLAGDHPQRQPWVAQKASRPGSSALRSMVATSRTWASVAPGHWSSACATPHRSARRGQLAASDAQHQRLDGFGGGGHHRLRARHLRHPIGQAVGPALVAGQQGDGKARRLIDHHHAGSLCLSCGRPSRKRTAMPVAPIMIHWRWRR
jgi:hypothetical protein